MQANALESRRPIRSSSGGNRARRKPANPLQAAEGGRPDQVARRESQSSLPYNRPEARTVQQQSMADRSPRNRQLTRMADRIDASPKMIAQRKRVSILETSRTSGDPVQLQRIFQPSEEGLKQVVTAMRERAVGAAENMLFDFDEYNSNYRYLVATNEAEGNAERFAIMSLGNAPAVQPGEPGGVNLAIDNSLWVEGLAADPGAGLGGALLMRAEEMADDEGWSGVALAAYEFDPENGDPAFSVAGYYGDRKGYTYTGEGYEEVDEEGDESYFYPIYSKSAEQIKEERALRGQG